MLSALHCLCVAWHIESVPFLTLLPEASRAPHTSTFSPSQFVNGRYKISRSPEILTFQLKLVLLFQGQLIGGVGSEVALQYLIELSLLQSGVPSHSEGSKGEGLPQ